MSAYTPEPWVAVASKAGRAVYIGQKGDGAVLELRGTILNPDELQADACRIVACVNACAGMSEPEARIAALRACEQEQGQFLVEMVRERDALRAERDGLRSALSAITDLYDTDEGCRSTPEYIAARAALAGSVS